MCDRSSVLVIFLILKIIVLIVLPFILIILYKRESKLFNIVCAINLVFLVLLIILRLVGNTCVSNSSFSYLRSNIDKKVIEEKTSTYYETVLSSNKYELNEGKKSYYYDINSVPLKDIEISCDKKSYMEQYGASLSAITSLISNSFSLEMNEMELINYLEDNKLIDCENGFDFNTVFTKLADEYLFNIIQISPSQIDSYILNGKNVLVETTNKYNEDNNFGCETSYLVIYNKNNDGNYGIINSNDHYDSYFCPSNTIGYGSIIEGNQNDKAYSFDMINSKALRYFVIEVR